MATPFENAHTKAQNCRMRLTEALTVSGGSLTGSALPEAKRKELLSLLEIKQEHITLLTTIGSAPPAPREQKGALPMRRGRYRFQKGAEKVAEAKLKEAIKEYEEKKKMIKALAASYSEDANIASLLRELEALEDLEKAAFEAAQKELNENMAGAVEGLRVVAEGMGPDAGAIGIALADSVEKKLQAERSAGEIKQRAEDEFRATAAESIKEDQPLSKLVGNITSSRNWMIHEPDSRGVGKLLQDLEEEQRGGGPLAAIENFFAYSINKGRVVHCKKVSGRWDFAHYYVECSREAAQRLFDKCNGTPTKSIDVSRNRSSNVATVEL